jgi:hypothetical protein
MLSLSRALAAGIAAVAVSVAGCTAAIGLSDYTFGGDGASPDASSATLPDRTEPRDASAGDADAGGSDGGASTGDGVSDASAGDAGTGGSDAADGASCSVDLATTCYPCAPATQPQFLNACTSAACVPFDDTRVTLLLPDGGLPPLPMQVEDAGTQ